MTEESSDRPIRDVHSHVLPLSIQERDGHVTIYCTGHDCHWSWRLYSGEAQTNGRAIDSAVRHALSRHLNQPSSGDADAR
jgi:hypothetical protein